MPQVPVRRPLPLRAVHQDGVDVGDVALDPGAEPGRSITSQLTSAFFPSVLVVTLTNRSRAMGRSPSATFSALTTWALMVLSSRLWRLKE